MIELIFRLYRFVFARTLFFKFNKFLYRCSLSGMGVLNYQNDKISGENKFLRGTLGKTAEPLVLDVGANTGKYSQLVLGINPASRIFAFEPHPRTYETLCQSMRGTSVNTVNAATSDQAGEVELFDYAHQDGSEHASLMRGVIEDIRGAQVVSHRIRTLRLDDFADASGIKVIDLLKIDTEGSELSTLKGASRLLRERRIRAIQFEFNEMNVASRSYFKDFWGLLADFDLYRLLPDGQAPISEYSPIYCEIFAFQNIVAILRPESAEPRGLRT